MQSFHCPLHYKITVNHFFVHYTIITTFNNVEPIKVLTAARPSKISLVFIKDSKRHHALTSQGFVVVKFEYLSPEEEQKINTGVDYIEAFPTKGF